MKLNKCFSVHQQNYRINPLRSCEEGVVIVLVAVFMLFVVGAMAALSIDVVTLYTARSEAQLAADGAALSAARALANSGMTSDPTDTAFSANAEIGAKAVAQQIAISNSVGGSPLTLSEVTISFNDGDTNFGTNPQVTVRISRNDLPTFFARIWGRRTLAVAASATAEAYNSSGMNAAGLSMTPVAPTCVKPWLLPNIDPTSTSGTPTIFDPDTGAISNMGLLGWASPNGGGSTRLQAQCDAPCLAGSLTPTKWQYYQGDDASFPHPTQALPACALVTDYQKSIAGCVQQPIVCGRTVTLNNSANANRDTEAADAVDCLTHTSNNEGDSIGSGVVPPTPFAFMAGDDNPVVIANSSLQGKQIIVSDSLVTVPVFDNRPWPNTDVTGPVRVIGFVQLFLNNDGNRVPTRGNPSNRLHIRTKIINMVGCGTGATLPPIFGNGSSPVAVRLISP